MFSSVLWLTDAIPIIVSELILSAEGYSLGREWCNWYHHYITFSCALFSLQPIGKTHLSPKLFISFFSLCKICYDTGRLECHSSIIRSLNWELVWKLYNIITPYLPFFSPSCPEFSLSTTSVHFKKHDFHPHPQCHDFQSWKYSCKPTPQPQMEILLPTNHPMTHLRPIWRQRYN